MILPFVKYPGGIFAFPSVPMIGLISNTARVFDMTLKSISRARCFPGHALLFFRDSLFHWITRRRDMNRKCQVGLWWCWWFSDGEEWVRRTFVRNRMLFRMGRWIYLWWCWTIYRGCIFQGLGAHYRRWAFPYRCDGYAVITLCKIRVNHKDIPKINQNSRPFCNTIPFIYIVFHRIPIH